jgi:hypothetical protein
MVRATGRGGDKGRRREEGEEKRGRRFPPPAEVAYELLSGAGTPLSLEDLASTGAERQLMPDAFGRDLGALASALAEDNRRREAAGRRPLFLVEGETVTLVAQPEPGERVAPAASATRGTTPGELRRAGLAALRRRLRECDTATVEHLVIKLLERLGYRELKVARRGKDHVLVTARKRMGLGEVRHGFRVLRSGADATRRDVVETRRDLGHYGAQIGAVITAGEAQRDARGDAQAAGQLPVLLLCGEALAEAFVEASLGCSQVVVPVVDDAFFAAATEAAAREEAARPPRREERDRDRGGREKDRERGERRDRRPEGEQQAATSDVETAPPQIGAEPQPEHETPAELEAPLDESQASSAAPLPSGELAADAELDGDDGDEDDDGEDDGAEGAEGAEPGSPDAAAAALGSDGRPAGDPRRKRRRRRRRGGRGRGERRDGAPGAAGEAGEPQAAGAPPGGEGGGAAPTPAGPPAGGGSEQGAGGA